MTLHLFLLLASVFMGGMATAVIIIPNIIEFVKKKTMSNAEWAAHLTEKKEKYNAKKVRRSEVFKKRLKAILDTIEEISKDKTKRRRLTITSMGNCNTDREIRRSLRERGFDIEFEYEGKNSLTILWREKS